MIASRAAASSSKRGAAWLLALPLVLAIAVWAGCGGEDEGNAGDDPAVERPAEPDPDAEDNGRSQRVLEACREVVDRAPGVSEEMKRDLIERCEEGAADDAEAARTAAEAACEAIAAATVPGPLRGPAAAACKRAIPNSTRL